MGWLLGGRGGRMVVVPTSFVFSSFSRKDYLKSGKHLGVRKMLQSSPLWAIDFFNGLLSQPSIWWVCLSLHSIVEKGVLHVFNRCQPTWCSSLNIGECTQFYMYSFLYLRLGVVSRKLFMFLQFIILKCSILYSFEVLFDPFGICWSDLQLLIVFKAFLLGFFKTSWAHVFKIIKCCLGFKGVQSAADLTEPPLPFC